MNLTGTSRHLFLSSLFKKWPACVIWSNTVCVSLFISFTSCSIPTPSHLSYPPLPLYTSCPPLFSPLESSPSPLPGRSLVQEHINALQLEIKRDNAKEKIRQVLQSTDDLQPGELCVHVCVCVCVYMCVSYNYSVVCIDNGIPDVQCSV